ncbi:TPA_asm: hypothetical protein [Monosiga MELD virus 1]|nr:TPA_asm: hypothetical protein [Monosiga MELD virus 1]
MHDGHKVATGSFPPDVTAWVVDLEPEAWHVTVNITLVALDESADDAISSTTAFAGMDAWLVTQAMMCVFAYHVRVLCVHERPTTQRVLAPLNRHRRVWPRRLAKRG